jgi:hypothetical protein
MACAVKSFVSKHVKTVGMEFRWKISSILKKFKSSRSSMTTKELKAVKSLRHSKVIRIFQTDRGNCMVELDETKYKDKLSTLPEFEVYEHLPKDPTGKVERKV